MEIFNKIRYFFQRIADLINSRILGFQRTPQVTHKKTEEHNPEITEDIQTINYIKKEIENPTYHLIPYEERNW